MSNGLCLGPSPGPGPKLVMVLGPGPIIFLVLPLVLVLVTVKFSGLNTQRPLIKTLLLAEFRMCLPETFQLPD